MRRPVAGGNSFAQQSPQQSHVEAGGVMTGPGSAVGAVRPPRGDSLPVPKEDVRRKEQDVHVGNLVKPGK
jgi:hypothetical protein